MRKGDKITLKNHPECERADCILEEYTLKGRTFLHAVNEKQKILLAVTSPEGEPWNIVTIKAGMNGANEYEATWQRVKLTLDKFKHEI